MKKEGSFERKLRTRHYRSMMSVTSPVVDWDKDNISFRKGILGSLMDSPIKAFPCHSKYCTERVSLGFHHPLFFKNLYVGVL